MLLDIELLDESVTFSYFNEKGDIELKTYDTTQFPVWYACGEDDRKKSKHYTNWDGKPIKPQFGKKLSKHGIIEFIESLPKEDSDKIFGYNFPKTFFFDIEVEVKEGFPEADRADSKILTILSLFWT